jgi:DNA-binding transcriptional LysR family regulator
VLSTRREGPLATLRDATWIAGCERCRSHLLSLCADAGFDPRIGYSSDDMVVMQAWVAAGLGVATQTGLALRAHHIDGVVATELPAKRHIYAATYGEPPDPPATAALLAALAEAATATATVSASA